MAEKTELEIVIGTDGVVRIVTRGLRGEACIEETRTLERALGEVRKREKTREFYEQAAAGKDRLRNR
jgi:hypothetical protein